MTHQVHKLSSAKNHRRHAALTTGLSIAELDPDLDPARIPPPGHKLAVSRQMGSPRPQAFHGSPTQRIALLVSRIEPVTTSMWRINP
jgi:hypothetical protein